MKRYTAVRQCWLDARRKRLTHTECAELLNLLDLSGKLSIQLSRAQELHGAVGRISDLLYSLKVDLKMIRSTFDVSDDETATPTPKKPKKKSKKVPTPAPDQEGAWAEVLRLAAEIDDKPKKDAAADQADRKQAALALLVAKAERRVQKPSLDPHPSDPASPWLGGRHFKPEPRLVKVFKTLFWAPVSPIPEPFKWNDFVDAVKAIHFEAEHLSGSMWLFHRAGCNIWFQEAPYNAPSSRNMSLSTARNYGKRLGTRYGLCIEKIHELEGGKED